MANVRRGVTSNAKWVLGRITSDANVTVTVTARERDALVPALLCLLIAQLYAAAHAEVANGSDQENFVWGMRLTMVDIVCVSLLVIQVVTADVAAIAVWPIPGGGFPLPSRPAPLPQPRLATGGSLDAGYDDVVGGTGGGMSSG